MNWKRAALLTAFVGGPMIALLSYGMTRDPRSIPSPLPGRAAPDFTRAVFAPGNDAVLRLHLVGSFGGGSSGGGGGRGHVASMCIVGVCSRL